MKNIRKEGEQRGRNLSLIGFENCFVVVCWFGNGEIKGY